VLRKDRIAAASTGPRYTVLSGETVALLASLLSQRYSVFIDRDDDTDFWIDRALDEVISFGMVGTVIFHMGIIPPVGTLVCDGSTFDRVTFLRLWSVLPDTMKTETTFTLPDMINATVRGSNAPGSEGGSDVLYLTESQLPPHAHTTGNSLSGLALAPGELPVLTPNPIPTYTGTTGSGSAIDITNAYVGLLPCVIAY